MYKLAFVPWGFYLYALAVDSVGLYDYHVVCLLVTFLACGAVLGMSSIWYIQDRRQAQ